MRILKHVAAVLLVALVVALVTLVWSRPSRYERFMRHTPDYFVELAQASDAFFKAHNGATNRMVSFSGQDPTLPPIIRNLRPDEIRVHPNRLWIGLGNDRESFAILWETDPDTAQTNTWVLMTDYDGVLHKIYSEIRR